MAVYKDSGEGANVNQIVGYQAGSLGALADLTDLFGWPVGVPTSTACWTSPGGVSGSVALTLDRLCLVPMLIARKSSVTDLAVNVTTLGASSVVRLGIFKFSHDMTTLDRVIDGGTVSGASTGVKELAITPTTLEPGVYMLGVCAQTAGCTITGGGTSSDSKFNVGWHAMPRTSIASDFAATGASAYAYFASVSGGFASSYTWSSHTIVNSTTQAAPAIALKWVRADV